MLQTLREFVVQIFGGLALVIRGDKANQTVEQKLEQEQEQE